MNCEKMLNIYVVIDPFSNNAYIGSTLRSLETRLEEHKLAYRNFSNGDTSQKWYSVFSVFKKCKDKSLNSIEIRMIETVPYDGVYLTKLKMEQNFIDEFRALKQWNILNHNNSFNSETYDKSKAYRDLYKTGNKCKNVIEIDGKLYTISISPFVKEIEKPDEQTIQVN